MSDITNRKSNTKVLITLVHGTWARFRFPFSAPAWFDKNSSFSQHLLRSLAENDISAEITAFIWSGANSLAHRKDAAHQLSRALSKQHANYPDLPQLTIGHSHGEAYVC
jgi:hypothetical protein